MYVIAGNSEAICYDMRLASFPNDVRDKLFLLAMTLTVVK